MTRRRAHRLQPQQGAARESGRPIPAPAARDHRPGLLHLQQTVGNQAVRRSIEGRGGIIRRAPGSLDSRVDPVEVTAADATPVVKERKVSYEEARKGANDPFGATESNVRIEYSVDDTGAVTVGALRPEYVVTLYTPVIQSDEFVEKFGPIAGLLWDRHGGNMAEWAQSSEVANFNYGPQTLRHENMHVAARQLALRDILPGYLGFLKRTGARSSVSQFLEKTDLYFRVAWNERAEQIAPHERIHYLDAVTMLEEYRQRAATEPKKPKDALDYVKDFFAP